MTARSESPSSFGGSPSATPSIDQKTANEAYFSSLGKANENRPDHLPPSQGGKYAGFGNAPISPANTNPLSSANAPSFQDLQENPVAALSKGWSLFAAAVAGATKVVSENVIQPGVEKVTDPSFQATVRGYMTEAQKAAVTAGSTANQWSKNQLGVDVADTVGGVVGTVRDRVGGGGYAGYNSLSTTSPGYHEENSRYDDDDDLFTEYRDASAPAATSTAGASKPSAASAKPAAKANDWDDKWEDF